MHTYQPDAATTVLPAPHPNGLGSQHRLRILVVLQNEMVRCGLCTMLQSLPTVISVDSCIDPGLALEALESQAFDAVILSSALLEQDAETALRIASHRETRTLLLLRSAQDHYEMSSLGIPVDGFFIESDLTVSVLDEALTQLGRGEMPIPSSLAREMLAQLRQRARSRPDRPLLLTPREKEALTLLVEGLSNKQIARRLGISEHGAKRHVANVLAKLNCPNRTLAVALALRDGLLSEA
ncbi:MAG: response regulator transcription factor [Streptomyces sp.]|nr:response regulator transcription factor [Streptomyces sp.]